MYIDDIVEVTGKLLLRDGMGVLRWKTRRRLEKEARRLQRAQCEH